MKSPDRFVQEAENLCSDSPELMELVQTGEVDLARAVVVDDVMRAALEPGSREWKAVIGLMTQVVPGSTVGQVRSGTRTAIDIVDATASSRQRAKARSERSVTAHRMSSGMSALTAILPSDKAMFVDAILDSLANSIRDEQRTDTEPDPEARQRRRADAFVAVFAAVGQGIASPRAPHSSQGTTPETDSATESPAARTQAQSSGATEFVPERVVLGEPAPGQPGDEDKPMASDLIETNQRNHMTAQDRSWRHRLDRLSRRSVRRTRERPAVATTRGVVTSKGQGRDSAG